MSNPETLRPVPFTSETGRENQPKSVKSRKRNKTIAETTDRVLSTKVTDPDQLAAIRQAGLPVPKNPTYKDFLVASIVLRTTQKGRIDDLEKLMGILGEAPNQANADAQAKQLSQLFDALEKEESE